MITEFGRYATDCFLVTTTMQGREGKMYIRIGPERFITVGLKIKPTDMSGVFERLRFITPCEHLTLVEFVHTKNHLACFNTWFLHEMVRVANKR